ncbi:hypothetical protein M153_100038763 [Pseudoloma neurophilia]|uniref:Uncharacterized protein n=1 Tax=Pseudoloma neurophilia TaxID=146866 RepID=A0A0R0M8A8_9MICR|nr:hypothetical protein M153_100038763 [Pseudoloma neurophilia]
MATIFFYFYKILDENLYAQMMNINTQKWPKIDSTSGLLIRIKSKK